MDKNPLKREPKALHQAVRKEVERKSQLGQYVIVSRNGKTVRILASNTLRESDASRNPAQ